MTTFTTATPESQGVSSRSILRFLEKLSQNQPYEEPHALLILRHGKLLAEGYFAPFNKDSRHTLFSVSKSIISTAVGFCAQEGLLNVEDLIADYFPEYLPETPAPEFKLLKIRHVLSMTVGQEGVGVHMALRGVAKGIPEAFFRTPFLDNPGTTFRYASAATHMLAKLVHKVTGEDAISYLTPRLFDPLGIVPPTSLKSPEGELLGFTGMRLTAREMATYGQFYLNKGSWNGKQLLNPEWITEASKKHIDTDSSTGGEWSQGYCWQFWRGSHNTFRFCGAHGQMCIISPDKDFICFVNSGYNNTVLQYVIDSFYSTIWEDLRDEPYAEDPEAQEKLNTLLAGLSLPVVRSSASPLESLLGEKTYTFTEGPFRSLCIRFAARICYLDAVDADGNVRTMRVGLETPVEEVSSLADLFSLEPADRDLTQSFGWWNPMRELHMVARVLPTPTTFTMDMEFCPDGTLKLSYKGYRSSREAEWTAIGK